MCKISPLSVYCCIQKIIHVWCLGAIGKTFAQVMFSRDETIRSSHDTIRIDTKGDNIVIFDMIKIIIVKIQTFTVFISFNLWTQQRNACLVSFTNTVTRFTRELDKTNLFVKLKKQCTVEVFNKNVKKVTLVFHSIYKQETPQCDETRFSTLQPSIDMTGIKNERWHWRKNDAIILVASVACTKFGVNRPKQTKVIERKPIFLGTVTLTLITDTWVAIPSCVLM